MLVAAGAVVPEVRGKSGGCVESLGGTGGDGAGEFCVAGMESLGGDGSLFGVLLLGRGGGVWLLRGGVLLLGGV